MARASRVPPLGAILPALLVVRRINARVVQMSWGMLVINAHPISMEV